MLRCHSYRHRPAQIDMLHVDIWHQGKNIFCDSGSYSYNTNPILKEEFIGIQGHNTVKINSKNHMQPVLKFGYSNWTKSKLIKKTDTSFIGEHYGYKQHENIIHRREVSLIKKEIHIIDSIFTITKKTVVKQQLITPYSIEKKDKSIFIVDNKYQVSSSMPGLISDHKISNHYNHYEKGCSISFKDTVSSSVQINTKVNIL